MRLLRRSRPRWDYLPLRWCTRCDGMRPHTDRGGWCLGCLKREQEAT